MIKLSFIHRSTSLCEEKCKDDQECGNKEICLHEECQKGCRNDYHCITGTKCYENICITSCKKNKDCQPSQYCHIDHKVNFSLVQIDFKNEKKNTEKKLSITYSVL